MYVTYFITRYENIIIVFFIIICNMRRIIPPSCCLGIKKNHDGLTIIGFSNPYNLGSRQKKLDDY